MAQIILTNVGIQTLRPKHTRCKAFLQRQRRHRAWVDASQRHVGTTSHEIKADAVLVDLIK